MKDKIISAFLDLKKFFWKWKTASEIWLSKEDKKNGFKSVWYVS